MTIDVRNVASFTKSCTGSGSCTQWNHVCDTSNVAAHIGFDNVDDIGHFDRIGAMNEGVMDTVALNVTGKDLLIFVLLIVNAFTLMAVACRQTKCCKTKQKKVIYEPVSIVSENESIQNQ